MDKIKGQQELSQEEIDLTYLIKMEAEQIGELVDKLKAHPDVFPIKNIAVGYTPGPHKIPLDQDWVSIGKTHLQQGFMALTRAVAKPEGF